jgi:acetyl esterase/lipase
MSTYKVKKTLLDGHSLFTLNKKQTAWQKTIFYLHGGAYIDSFVRPHWDFMYNLIQELDCAIVAPDYPLAPDNTFRQTFAMLLKVYKDLIKEIDPAGLILMGDSSGGGLALALAQLSRNERLAPPQQIILLSPWLDIGLSNPEIKDVDPSDYFLGTEGLKMAAEAYAGGVQKDYYLLSPMYGDLEGLARISLFIGSREILVADARKLNKLAKEKEIHINYREYPGMFHAWMLLNLPESRKARSEIYELIRKG